MDSREKTVEVLYIENKKTERLLFDLALHETSKKACLKMATDCNKALEMLAEQEYMPDIIFLDWKMPQKGGIECLAEIRSNKKFDHIPVIIFSISNSEKDIKDAFDKGANRYVQKPFDINQQIKLMNMLFDNSWDKLTSRPAFKDFVLKP